MHWTIAAPFIAGPGDTWLDRYVTGGRHSFTAVPAGYRHDRSRRQTGLLQWRDYVAHGNAAWRTQRAFAGGIVTLFPQLALTVGLRQRATRRRVPLLAWTFNVGRLRDGARQRLSRLALAGVDRIVVHSRAEIATYSAWLDLDPGRFRFVPLQRPARPITEDEDVERPFVLSMGSAQRDYRLFLAVMGGLGLPTVIVAGPQALAGLRLPPNVELRSGLDIAECHRLAQRARVNVVPIDNPATASGQVTLVDAMMFARATVATRSIGTEDYVDHGRNGLLVPPGEPAALRDAVAQLWDDAGRRAALGAAARRYVLDQLSDEAAGASLGALLDELAAAHAA